MGMALGTKKPTSDINVTPLIDVVLVLLIIFMVLTPLAEKQKFMRVPDYQPEMQPVPPDTVPPDQTILTALRNGNVLLNRQEMSARRRCSGSTWRTTAGRRRCCSSTPRISSSTTRSSTCSTRRTAQGVNTIGMMTRSAAHGAGHSRPGAPQ